MGKLKFYCDVCKKDLDKCQCPDLKQRFEERFAGSCISNMAMAAVEAVRGVNTVPDTKRRERREAA